MEVAEAGMVHLRLVVRAADVSEVLGMLERSRVVVNLVRLPDVSLKPKGDLVLCDVAREEVSVVVENLRRLGLDRSGSISIDAVDSIISTDATRAVRAAAGSPADAVIWEEVEARTSESAELSFSFLAFMILATLIAAVGILTDSQVLIIGAMVVGQEFGPLAGLCVALVQRRTDLARRSATALAVGFPLAILITVLLVLLLRTAGAAPDHVAAQQRPATFFISHPNTFSVLTALLAGVAGLLSLTTASRGRCSASSSRSPPSQPQPMSAWPSPMRTGRSCAARSPSSPSTCFASSPQEWSHSQSSVTASYGGADGQRRRGQASVLCHDRRHVDVVLVAPDLTPDTLGLEGRLQTAGGDDRLTCPAEGILDRAATSSILAVRRENRSAVFGEMLRLPRTTTCRCDVQAGATRLGSPLTHCQEAAGVASA